MRFEKFSFGSIRVDRVTYEHDVVIDRGEVRKRKKKPSKKFRELFGHTPVSIEEKIPWQCRRLIVGTRTGRLPVMEEVKTEARRRKIALLVLRGGFSTSLAGIVLAQSCEQSSDCLG